MQQLMNQVLDYLRGMWHRRWIGLVAAWAVAIAGLVVVYQSPDRYEASARLYVDTETLLKPVLAGLAIAPNIDQQVALISRTLISRPNIEKLVRMNNLDRGVTSNLEREELYERLMNSIRLSSAAQSNLFFIAYRDRNPERAKQVVQSLLNIFMDPNQGDRRQETRNAVQFLDEQIRLYEQNLQAAEGRMKEFKVKYDYLGVSGREGQDFQARLSQLKMGIEGARVELNAALQTRDSYKRELAGAVPASLATADSPMDAVADIDTRLAALKKELDEQTRKYTDKHPEVINTRALIADLQRQRQAHLADARNAMAGGSQAGAGGVRGPVLQQLRISLADAEASAAAARAKVAGLESQYQTLQSQAKIVPQVESEFAQLNRDYDVQKRTYESLLARREAAGMGLDAQDSGGARFKVIDPPRVSPYPVKPTRLALLGVSAVASLLAGLVASLIASLLLPVFHHARGLRDAVKRPILGMVSMLPTDDLVSQKRRNALLLAGGVAGLVAVFATTMILLDVFGPVA